MTDTTESSDEMESMEIKAVPPLLQKLKTKFSFKKNKPSSSKSLKKKHRDNTDENDGSDDARIEKPKKKVKGKETYARVGNAHASKKTRKVQLGLKVDGVHVRREDHGGGKRFASMNKDAVKDEIMCRAKSFFFPNGMSKYVGPIADFTFELNDFQENPVNSSDTIGSLYESTGLGLLRFYLCATSKIVEDETNGDSDTSVFSVSPFKKKHASTSNFSHTGHNMHGRGVIADTSSLSDVEASTSSNALPNSSTSSGRPSATQELSTLFVGDFTVGDTANNAESLCLQITDPSGIIDLHEIVSMSDPSISAPAHHSFIDLGTPTVQIRNELCNEEVVVEAFSETNESDEGARDLYNAALEPLYEAVDADFNLEYRSQASTASTVTVDTIRLHRGQVLTELTSYYKTHDVKNTVEVQMLLPNGIEEAGEDNGGVMRDALSEFWEEFFEMNTVGENFKVPCLRHNMTQADWQACARVLVVGFRQEGYFPVQLAPPFLQFTLDGDDAVEEKSLLDNFLEYTPECEREIFSRALKDFQTVEEDDLLDALDSHSVRVRVTSSNIEAVLKEVAHKEIVQAPAYVARCWHDIVQDIKPLLKETFDEMRDRMVPTTELVLQAIHFPDDMTEGQSETAKMLKRYVKSLSREKLRRFLRFLTGKTKPRASPEKIC